MKKLIVFALLVLAAVPTLGADKSLPDPMIATAHWIWIKAPREEAAVYFRKSFDLSGKPGDAEIQITCRDQYELWINAKLVGKTKKEGPDAWRTADTYDLEGLLAGGKNVIVVRANNHTGKAALLAALAVDMGKKPGVKVGSYEIIASQPGTTVRIATDSSWETTIQPGDDWQQGQSNGDWQAALDYGEAADTLPWLYPHGASKLAPYIEQSKPALKTGVESAVAVKVEPGTTAEVSGLVPSSEGEAGRCGKMSVEAKAGDKVIISCDFGKEALGHRLLVGNCYGDLDVSLACGEFASECNAPISRCNR